MKRKLKPLLITIAGFLTLSVSIWHFNSLGLLKFMEPNYTRWDAEGGIFSPFLLSFIGLTFTLGGLYQLIKK